MKDKINSTIDKLFEKPLIAIPVSIFAYYIPWFLFGKLGSTTVASYTIRIIVGLMLTIFVYWLRKDHMYSCGIKKHGIKAFTPIIPIVVIFVLTMIFRIANTPDISALLFIYTGIMAIEAGFCEEFMVRGIPLGNTLWRHNNLKQIIWISIYSSVIFGLLHLGNVVRTGSLAHSGMQAFVDIFAGLFFVAVYLRSGSIIPGIVAHALWDYLLMFDPKNMVNGDFQPISKITNTLPTLPSTIPITEDQLRTIIAVTTVLLILIVATAWILLTLFILRKSKRNDIVANFTKE